MYENENYILFSDNQGIKKVNIKLKIGRQYKYLIKESDELNSILSFIYDELQKKNVSSVPIIDIQKDNEDKILYRPYESFTRSPHWTAGRFVGEMVFTLPDNNEFKKIKDKQIKLIVAPRFGNYFICHMLEEITNFKLPESVVKEDRGTFWSKLYQLILRQIWISKFAKADKYGVPRHTVKRTNQGMQIRGHLNVRKSIFPFFVKQEAVSEYREKEIDDVIGRIVYKAYNILADKKTGLRNLPQQVRESVNALSSRYLGQQIKINEQDYQNIHYKSIYMSWKPLVDFSWQVIKHRGYDPEKNVEDQGFGLFFDMAEIWEVYVGKILKKEFVHCTNVNSNIRLFANENGKEFQSIIPDYLSLDWDDESASAVGDAKYMDLAYKENLQGEQTYSVYYKTIMYMYRFNSTKGFIFFPISHDHESNDVREFKIKGEKRGSLFLVGMRLPDENKNTKFASYHYALRQSEEQFIKATREGMASNG